jgi:putative phosphoribosyl transferase
MRAIRSPHHEVGFRDRHHAGRELAAALAAIDLDEPLVVGLPRGGVVVAYEVALALDAPLDIVVVRKLGAPFQPEYAIGALGEEGVLLVDEGAVDAFALRAATLDRIVEAERAELDRRSRRFRDDTPPLPVEGRAVLLVDDGVATGSTARAAARVLRRRGAARIVLAVPVGPADVCDRFVGDVDEVVCLERPGDFFGVGQAYEAFRQTSDEEVEELLRAAAARGRQRAEAEAGANAYVPGRGMRGRADGPVTPRTLTSREGQMQASDVMTDFLPSFAYAAAGAAELEARREMFEPLDEETLLYLSTTAD